MSVRFFMVLLAAELAAVPAAVAQDAPEAPLPDSPRLEKARALFERMNSRFYSERQEARDGFNRYPEEGALVVDEALFGGDRGRCRMALEVLRRIEPEKRPARLSGPRITKRLLSLLDDEDKEIADLAMSAVVRAASGNPELLEVLRKRFRRESRSEEEYEQALKDSGLLNGVTAEITEFIAGKIPNKTGFYDGQFAMAGRHGEFSAIVLRDLVLRYIDSGTDPGDKWKECCVEALGDMSASVKKARQALEQIYARFQARNGNRLDSNVTWQRSLVVSLYRHGVKEPFKKLLAGVEATLKSNPDSARRVRFSLALLYSRVREHDKAIEQYRRYIVDNLRASGGVPQPGEQTRRSNIIAYYNISCALSQAGRKAQALRFLRRAVADGGGRDGNQPRLEWIKEDGDLNNIRGTDGYIRLIAYLEQYAKDPTRVTREQEEAAYVRDCAPPFTTEQMDEPVMPPESSPDAAERLARGRAIERAMKKAVRNGPGGGKQAAGKAVGDAARKAVREAAKETAEKAAKNAAKETAKEAAEKAEKTEKAEKAEKAEKKAVDGNGTGNE